MKLPKKFNIIYATGGNILMGFAQSSPLPTPATPNPNFKTV